MVAITEPNWRWREHIALAADAGLIKSCKPHLHGGRGLPVNFLPDMTYPMVKVNIFWSGATPEEIERGLAEPIERQLMTVDGLDYLESSSIEGMYSLIANFRYGVNIDTAAESMTVSCPEVGGRSLCREPAGSCNPLPSGGGQRRQPDRLRGRHRKEDTLADAGKRGGGKSLPITKSRPSRRDDLLLLYV